MTGHVEAQVVSELGFVVEQSLRAPAAQVFAAYTEPDLLSQWWAPKGGSVAIEAMDVRPGGAYRFVRRDAQGHSVVFVGRYLEVRPVERLVYTFGVEGQRHEITAVVELTESAGTTAIRLTNLCASREIRDAILQHGAVGGARAALHRLVGLLDHSGAAVAG